jgi:hypothetical protein
MIPSCCLPKAGTDSLKISGQACCGPFSDDWLSHPDHVHPHSSDFPSSKIYPEPFGDLGIHLVEPVILLVGLIWICRQVLVCLAAAVSLFAMWCAVKARENTTHIAVDTSTNGLVPRAQASPAYNAAASANMGVWLFFEVWLINTSVLCPLVCRSSDSPNRFRAYRPQYFLPSIIFSVFINVTGTYGTIFQSMQEAEALGDIFFTARPSQQLIGEISSLAATSNFFCWFRNLSCSQPFYHPI